MRIALFAILVCALVACSGTPPSGAGDHQIQQLKIIDQKVGTGIAAQAGMKVTVDYTGWLYDQTAADHHGRKFDSSFDHGQHFTFTLGAGHVIAGWDQGVVGMRVGGKRELLVPASLGYGSRGAGNVIPPNATLVFEVILLNIAP